jgi:hypothetical protein
MREARMKWRDLHRQRAFFLQFKSFDLNAPTDFLVSGSPEVAILLRFQWSSAPTKHALPDSN